MADTGRPAGDPRPSASSNTADQISEDTDVWPIELIPQPAAPPPPSPQPPAPTPVPPPQQYSQPTYPYQQPGYPHAQGYPPAAYGQYAGYPPYQRRSGMGRGARLLSLLLLVLLVGLIALIVGLAGGFIRYNDLIRLAGMGPGEILVQNLRDEAITITLERLDADGSVAQTYGDGLEPADVRVFPNREVGPWNVAFATADGSRLGTCHLTVAGNGEYTFMVLPELVVIARVGDPPPTGDDFVLATSSLCRRDGP